MNEKSSTIGASPLSGKITLGGGPKTHQEQELPAAPGPTPQKNGSGVRASRHPDWVKRTFLIPNELSIWLAHRGIDEHLEQSEIVTKAIEAYRRQFPHVGEREG
jgi:hypothetical protein